MDKQITSFSRSKKQGTMSVNDPSLKHKVLSHSMGNYSQQHVIDPNGKEYEKKKKEPVFGGVKSWFQVRQFGNNGPSCWRGSQERKIPAHGWLVPKEFNKSLFNLSTIVKFSLQHYTEVTL